MEITLIGIIVIILSIIAFLKNENMLLELAMFFSVFTASMAIGIEATTTPIWPFEIPIIFWILKQFINLFSGKMKVDIKKNLISKKLLIAFVVFIIIMIAGELWIYINKMNISYYDYKFYKDMNITFTSRNITQPIRLMLFIIFSMLVIIKKISKEQINRIIKAFEYGCVFAIFWGGVQYFINMFNIEYPAFIFNNNPYVSQGYEQNVGNLKRITSIASEPPVLGFTLVTFLPLIVSRYQKANVEKDKRKYIYFILLCLTIIIGIVSTSSTFYLGFCALVLIYVIYKFLDKSKTLKNKMMHIVRVILLIMFLAIISLGLILLPKMIKPKEEQVNITPNSEVVTDVPNSELEIPIQNTNIDIVVNNDKNPTENKIEDTNIDIVINNNGNVEKNKEETKKEINGVIATLYELTINKLQSGSGKIRLNQEKVAMEHFWKSPILGFGYGTIATYILFINVLVNFGILGMINFIVIMFLCIKTIKINSSKNKLLAEGIIFSIISMIVCFASSICDLTYLFFWGILILGYKYFADNEENIEKNKDKLIIGIDGRSLDLKNRTGITTYMYETIKRLNNLDRKNIYYIYSNREVNLDFELNSNFEVRRYKCKKGTLGFYFKLPKILKKDNVDVLWGTQHCLPKRNEYTANIKFILTVHDLAIHKLKTVGEFKNTIIQRLFLKRSCKNADFIMADSKATKDDIVEIFGIDDKKIQVVYLGTNFNNEYNVSKKEENEILKKFDIKDKNYLFFVSTIEPRKNIVTLIKAFEELKKNKENKTLKLILAGGLGWKYQDILDTIEKSEFKEDINLAGYISKEEKECLFKNAKCFVYPSLYEGFGLPILEAMAKEAIVVTSNISSIPEVGGDAAFYLNDVHNENELASLIENVLKLNEETKEEIIEKGKNQVKKFTWEKCANEVLSIIR